MEVLEGIVFFFFFFMAFWIVVPPLIMIPIWNKRVKSGKSQRFGPLGIVTIIITASSIMSLPKFFMMIAEYFGWK